MRKFWISAAVATTALTVAVPAAAQWAPPPPPVYNAPPGYAYGHQGNWGQVRSLQVRVEALRRHIDRLDSRNRISEREADRLRGQANDLRRDLRRASRNGLHPAEMYRIERRLAALEYRIQRDVRDGNRLGDRRDGWIDRDRDGRDDRWERRRGDRDDDDD